MDEAIRRSEEWLEKNKQTFLSETDTGIQFKDNFADLLILELSNRWYVLLCYSVCEPWAFSITGTTSGTMWILESPKGAGTTLQVSAGFDD